MNSARMIEYRITRDLLQRRECEARHRSADQVIKGLAILSAVALVAVCLPQLLVPVFVACAVVTLGL